MQSQAAAVEARHGAALASRRRAWNWHSASVKLRDPSIASAANNGDCVMFNRRRVIQGGLAALGSVSAAAPFNALAQGKPLVKVRYNEVVRSVLYAPSYVALSKGYFKDAGL